MLSGIAEETEACGRVQTDCVARRYAVIIGDLEGKRVIGWIEEEDARPGAPLEAVDTVAVEGNVEGIWIMLHIAQPPRASALSRDERFAPEECKSYLRAMHQPEADTGYSAAEALALSSPTGAHVRLAPAEADALLANIAYHPSLGDPASAAHFRRSLEDGSCLHLIIADEIAELHRDLYDPHGGPSLLAAHLLNESPRPAASVALALVALLRRVSR